MKSTGFYDKVKDLLSIHFGMSVKRCIGGEFQPVSSTVRVSQEMVRGSKH